MSVYFENSFIIPLWLHDYMLLLRTDLFVSNCTCLLNVSLFWWLCFQLFIWKTSTLFFLSDQPLIFLKVFRITIHIKKLDKNILFKKNILFLKNRRLFVIMKQSLLTIKGENGLVFDSNENQTENFWCLTLEIPKHLYFHGFVHQWYC